MSKIGIEVIAHFNLDGEIVPLKIKINRENEEAVFCVDRPGKPVKGASMKIGVQGNRYSCFINGKRAYLYQNHENKWYIELV